MIYLDNAATTPVRPEVFKIVSESLSQDFGNPSSTYKIGRNAKQQIRLARIQIAEALNVDNPKSIYFTSGATESNNWALKTQAEYTRRKTGKNHLVTTAIEHPSVKEVMEYLETVGFEVTYLKPDKNGEISAEDFINASTDNTIGFEVMAVNNEVGSILPFKEIGQAAKDLGVFFHVDAVQALGHIDLDLSGFYFTSLALTGHKLGAPKGVGALVYQSDKPLLPYLHGGGQESTKRSGTENTPYIVGFSEAVKLASQEKNDNFNHYIKLQKDLFMFLDENGVDYEINGPVNSRVHHINSLWIKNVEASLALIQLDLRDIYVSAGSACSAGSLEPSHVLNAYYPDQVNRMKESLRISFGPQTSSEELKELAQALAQIQKGN